MGKATVTEAQVLRLAFLDELEKIASDPNFDDLIKEAILRAVHGFMTGAPKATGVIDPETGKEMMLSMKGGPASRGLLGGVGKSLESSGRTLRTAQAVPGAAAPSLAGRVTGGALEGAGKHIAHRSGLGIAINPLGVPFGGAIEGATHQVGHELQGRGLQRAGAFLKSHAGKAGVAGELAGLAGLGTALHAPLNAAAVAGKGVLGAALGKGALLSTPGVQELGGYAGHLAADVTGTALKGGTASAIQRALPFAGRLLRRAA